MAPVVSVVLPTFNRLQWLPAAVTSIQSQTLADWEAIVVDDGSTDGTEGWVRRLSEPRLRYVRHVHRGNIAAVRNIGLDEARGEWIAFLDSDDRWRPRKLVLQIERLANAGASWCYGAYELIDASGRLVAQPYGGPWRPFEGWITDRVLTTEASVTVQTVLVRAELARALRFDERIPLVDDYDFALRLTAHAPGCVVNDTVAEIRIHEERTTSQAGRYLGDLGKAMAYRKAARTLTDPRLRRLARRQQDAHFSALVWRAIRHGAAAELVRAVWSLWRI